MSHNEYSTLKSALVYSKMEGGLITPQTEQDRIRLLRQEISVADIVHEIL